MSHRVTVVRRLLDISSCETWACDVSCLREADRGILAMCRTETVIAGLRLCARYGFPVRGQRSPSRMEAVLLNWTELGEL